MSFSYFLYILLSSFTILPKNVFVFIFGNLFYLIDKRRKKVIEVNKKLSGIDFDTKKIYLNFVKHIYENIKFSKMSVEELKNYVTFEGFENLPKQVIFVTAHFGNWEVMPMAVGGILDYKLSIIGRKLDDEKLNEIIVKKREKFNVKVYFREGGLRNLMKDLKQGRSVGLLVDQNTAKEEGIETKFFEKRVLQTPSAALLSKKFKIPIAMVFCEPDGDKYKIKVVDVFMEDDIQKSVDRQSKIIEDEVRKYPEEYYWFHRRFKHFYEEEYA